jgi:hypothetical protein
MAIVIFILFLLLLLSFKRGEKNDNAKEGQLIPAD